MALAKVPIEVDITYVNKTWISNKRVKMLDSEKHYVIGIYQRGGEAVITALKDNEPETIHKAIISNVSAGAELFAEQGLLPESLDDLYDIFEYPKGKHADGEVHANTVKSLWRDLKRDIKRTHVHVSQQYLNAYCASIAWNFNNKHLSHWERFEKLLALSVRTEHRTQENLIK